MSKTYEVILDGGGPWGIRLQGGKDFGIPLNVEMVTASSKADMKRVMAGDTILRINDEPVDELTYMEARNLLESASDRLQLILKQGRGVSLGEVKHVGGSNFNATPGTYGPTGSNFKTGEAFAPSFKPNPGAYEPTGPNFKTGDAFAPPFKPNPVGYPPQPRPFGASGATSATRETSSQSKRFDPEEYARKKKNELDSYRNEQQTDQQSGTLKMLQTPVGAGTEETEGEPPPIRTSSISKGQEARQAAQFGSYLPSIVIPLISDMAEEETSSGSEIPNCFACQQPLKGPFVTTKGKTWHAEHFCCSACNVSLQNQEAVEENNTLFCKNCYTEKRAPKCAHCNNAILRNSVSALGKFWHPEHFICCNCFKQLGSDGFLVDSGKAYCESCYDDLSLKCAKCGLVIGDGEGIEALNTNWHRNCFTCRSQDCNTLLDEKSMFVKFGMAYCGVHIF